MLPEKTVLCFWETRRGGLLMMLWMLLVSLFRGSIVGRWESPLITSRRGLPLTLSAWPKVDEK